MAAVEKPGRPLTVEANMGLVRQVAWGFRWALGTVLDEGDLMQAGAVGLMRALEKYDPERGALSTYAKPWITAEIQEAINHGRRTVRIPPKTEAKAYKNGESYPLDILQLDAPVFYCSEEAGTLTWKDTMRSDADPTAQLDELQRDLGLHDALDRLPARIQLMVRARFVEGLTWQAIGDRHGFSRERARQLVGQGVRAMRKHLEEVEMGSVKRRVRKRAERHLKLIQGGKREPTKADFDALPAGGKEVLGGCDACREEYELGDVVCCTRCHAKGDTSYVEDPNGFFDVCCTVRKHLCPNENGPDHSAA